MQQFKPKFPRASNASHSVEKRAEKSPEKKGGIREIICPDNYSPIWQKAFALADNVRFTRTPDRELRRRRAAIDPAYAKILAEEEAARQRKNTDSETEGTETASAPQEAGESLSANQGHDRIEQMLEQAEAAFSPSHATDSAMAKQAETSEAILSADERQDEIAEQPKTEFGADAVSEPPAAEADNAVPAETEPEAEAPAEPLNQALNAQSFAAAVRREELRPQPAEIAEAESVKAVDSRIFPWSETDGAQTASPDVTFFKKNIAPKVISSPAADSAPQAKLSPESAAARLFKTAAASQQKIYWIPVPAEAVADIAALTHMSQPVIAAAMPPAAAPIPVMAVPPLMPAAYGFGAMAGLNYGTMPAWAAQARPKSARQSVAPAAEAKPQPAENIRPAAPMEPAKASAKPLMRVSLADYSDNFSVKPQPDEENTGAPESADSKSAAETISPAPVSSPSAEISVKADLAQEDLDRLCSTAVEKTERHTVMPNPQKLSGQSALPETELRQAEEKAAGQQSSQPVPVSAESAKPYPLPEQPKPVAKYSYKLPSLEFLQEPIYNDGAIISQETLERSAGLLESVLEDFGVKGEIIHVRPGPVVTLYEFEPAPGVKSSRVIGLADDIARSMSSVSARVAVIPGRNVIGIELPNKKREMVYLREILQSKAYQTSEYKLPLALGKLIGGEPIIAELAKMPHLLVAGTTGSGKSVAINTMILSLLYRMPPSQCRLIMVDPKMLELSIYDGIPHLLTPVVTDPKKALSALKWAVREMEERYRKMAKLGVRNIDGFNARVKEAALKGETIMCTVQAGFDKETGELLYTDEAMDLTPLPYIVIIVDEMADLMMVAGKEIEGAIQRLAQMARAAGIHLIMATQRPSVDVITGTIKANFPTRISFQVTSKIDSRTILGEQGAETLLGQGDMLYMAGGGRLKRVHGPFVSDREVEKVVAHLKTQGTPEYLATVTESSEEDEEEETSVAEIVAAAAAGGNDDFDELYIQAVKVVMRDKKCSTSYIQRRLGIGYNKAATLVEKMEEEGLVGEANHVGKREILVNNA